MRELFNTERFELYFISIPWLNRLPSKSSSLPRTKLKENMVPRPTFDLTPIFPPKVVTILSLITRPKPIPWVFICWVLLSVPKSLKSLARSFFFIPIPESMTEMAILARPLLVEKISSEFLSLSNSEILEASELEPSLYSLSKSFLSLLLSQFGGRYSQRI